MFQLSWDFNFFLSLWFYREPSLEFTTDWHVMKTLSSESKGKSFLPPWVWENCQGLRALCPAHRGNAASRVTSQWTWSVRRWATSDTRCMSAVAGTCLVTLPSSATTVAPRSQEVQNRQRVPRRGSSHVRFGTYVWRTPDHDLDGVLGTCHPCHRKSHPSSRMPSLCLSSTWTLPTAAYRGCCSPHLSAQQTTRSVPTVRLKRNLF